MFIMVEVIDLCTGCVQVITNPICPHCFSNHVITWARDKNLSKQEIDSIKKQLKTLMNEAEETPSSTKCIICGSKRVNLCIYCFTNKAFRIVEKNTNNKITNEFNEDFDTKIWRLR